jgi:hypothetical protein
MGGREGRGTGAMVAKAAAETRAKPRPICNEEQSTHGGDDFYRQVPFSRIVQAVNFVNVQSRRS